MFDVPSWFRIRKSHGDDGDDLLNSGKYADAEASLLKLASELETQSAPRIRQARILQSLATAQWKQKKLEAARETARRAHDLFVVKRKPSSEISACLNLRAAIAESENNIAEARLLLREALKAEQKVSPIQPRVLIERYHRLAFFLQENEGLAEAKDLLAEALELSEKRLGTRVAATADCLLHFGKCQLSLKEAEAGLTSLELALEIHREALGETAEDVVRDLHAIASAHRDAGDLEKAVKCYESALRVRERQLGADTTDLATLLIDFAGTYTQMGNDAPAMEMLQQAIGKLQGSTDPQLAEALESLGAGYVKWRRHAEAATYYQRARVIWEQDAAKYAKRLNRNAILLAGVKPNQSASAEHRVLTEPLMRVREKFLPSTTKRYTTPHSWNEADATIPKNDIPNVPSATPSQEPVSQPVAVSFEANIPPLEAQQRFVQILGGIPEASAPLTSSSSSSHGPLPTSPTGYPTVLIEPLDSNLPPDRPSIFTGSPRTNPQIADPDSAGIMNSPSGMNGVFCHAEIGSAQVLDGLQLVTQDQPDTDPVYVIVNPSNSAYGNNVALTGAVLHAVPLPEGSSFNLAEGRDPQPVGEIASPFWVPSTMTPTVIQGRPMPGGQGPLDYDPNALPQNVANIELSAIDKPGAALNGAIPRSAQVVDRTSRTTRSGRRQLSHNSEDRTASTSSTAGSIPTGDASRVIYGGELIADSSQISAGTPAEQVDTAAADTTLHEDHSACHISFVKGDGTVTERGTPVSTEPLRLTVIVPDDGLPQNSVLALNTKRTSPSNDLKLSEAATATIQESLPEIGMARPEVSSEVLRGWEELSFDYVSLA